MREFDYNCLLASCSEQDSHHNYFCTSKFSKANIILVVTIYFGIWLLTMLPT